MPISPSDILWNYSIPSPISGGYSSPQPNPNASLGGYISTTQWFGNTLDDLFSDVSGSANQQMQTDYRCVFIYNSNVSLTLYNTVIYISSQNYVAGHTVPAIGLDPFGAVPVNQMAQQATIVANVNAAPGGVDFSAPVTPGQGLAIGDLPAGYCAAVWISRMAVNGGALLNDGFTLTVLGDSIN